MGNSLFEQLKKSGLVDEKKAKQVKQSQYKSKKQKTQKGAPAKVNQATLNAQKLHAEKVERDRQLNQQKKAQADRKAIAAQITQLIETHHIQDCEGDITYNFTDGKFVKQLFVSETIHKHITTGKLAIAKRGDGYALVPAPVANKIEQRDPQRIIKNDQSESNSSSEDDPYANYKIPDDLMW